MIKAVDIQAELAGRPVLHGRGKATTDAEAQAVFATLAPFRDGGIFAGSFSGDSPWERHQYGDELVHILDGATTLTIMTDNGPQSFEMRKGMLVVVPQGHWHRFHAPEQVTVLTATPQPTDHTVAADPRTIAESGREGEIETCCQGSQARWGERRDGGRSGPRTGANRPDFPGKNAP